MKQVIVINKGIKMSRGRMVAQGAHASMAALLNFRDHPYMVEWLAGSFTKVVVQVPDAGALKIIYLAAQAQGIPCSYIVDNPHSNNPESTAVAVGPAPDDIIQALTGGLRLL